MQTIQHVAGYALIAFAVFVGIVGVITGEIKNPPPDKDGGWPPFMF